jgi:hypothetical protein
MVFLCFDFNSIGSHNFPFLDPLADEATNIPASRNDVALRRPIGFKPQSFHSIFDSLTFSQLRQSTIFAQRQATWGDFKPELCCGGFVTPQMGFPGSINAEHFHAARRGAQSA